MNHKQQSIVTRQTIENDMMEAYNGAPNDAPLGSIVIAHLQINNFLNQDDVDTLSGQMLAAQDDQTKRDILVLWHDWLIAAEKARKAVDAHIGYAGSWLTAWMMVSKADMAREKVEAIL